MAKFAGPSPLESDKRETEEDIVVEGSLVDITEEKEKEQISREREQDRLQRKIAEASAQAKPSSLLI